MKKFGCATIIASGMAAALLSLASPAHADLAHNIWANDQNGSASSSSNAQVPHVDTGVHH